MRASIAIAIACAVGGCTDGASASPGLESLLQIPGAQFRPGPFPAADGGPPTAQASLRKSKTARGVISERLDGALDHEAHAAIIGLDGVDGAWIVPAGAPDTDTPDKGSLHVFFGLTEEVPVGPFTILVASGDAGGKIGEAYRVEGIASEIRWPAGTLVVGLEWTGRADLDLHVIDPLGREAWSEDPNTWEPPPPGVPVDPNEYKTGGILDHDGNSRCAQDGAPTEHVAWMMAAPPGDYTLRVEARSMCGAPIADWYVAAYTDVTFDSDGVLLGAARGISSPADVQLPHGRGAGTTALRFTIP